MPTWISNLHSSKLWIILVIYIGIAIGSGTQNYLISGKPDKNGGLTMKYNNYLIFKYSSFNLAADNNLYALQVDQAKDLYKYSPAFAVLFGTFAWLPDFIGLNLWNLLNVLILFFSITFLPNLNDKQKRSILLFIAIELVTSTQNSQSNALIAGLLIFAFGLLERKRFLLATLLIVLTFYIKIFGVIAFLLFLFYYKEKLKLFKYSAFWLSIFFILPLFVVGWDQFVYLYHKWFYLLQSDHAASNGISVIGTIKMIFPGATLNNTLIVVIGFVLLVLPFLRTGNYPKYPFRILALCSILLWMVIFNHKAESATFIIAITGIAIWFFSRAFNTVNLLLLILAFVITSLSSTDLIPVDFRDRFIDPYCLKVIPCIVIWLKIILEMSFERFPIKENQLSNQSFVR